MSLPYTSGTSFFLVWNPARKRNPGRQHATREAAAVEADRLAAKQPGDIFVVLESVASSQVIP